MERGRAIEQMLDERGRGTRVRVAFGRSGVAVGFPREPIVHVSWWAIAGGALLVWLRRRRSR